MGNVGEADWLLDAVFDAIPTMVFVKRASDLTYVRANAAGRRFHGRGTDELAGKTVFDVFPPGSAERLQQLERRAVQERRTVLLDNIPLETPIGPRRFWGQVVPLTGPRGQVELLITVVRDVTDEYRLRQDIAVWMDVFYHAQWGIVIGDPSGTTLEQMNPAFARMHGSTVEELRGTSLLDVFHPDVRAEVPGLIQLAHEQGHLTFESIHIRKDGTAFPVLVDVTAVAEPGGGVKYRVVNVQDISALKQAERGLHAARAEAERASQAKSEFLSRMSHELRTPLNVILGFAQVLQLDELTESQNESVGHILHAGRHLLALIDDVLDISRIESGKMALSLEPVAIGDAIEDVVRLMQPLAREKQVTLGLPGPDCQSHVLTDRQRLKQVLLNLVTNGIKYNVQGGSLTITCDDDGEHVTIAVSDTGIGFPEDAIDRLFVPFDRLGREASEVEGTGLGLSLCKGLVEAMGGTIEARPNPGGGSVFIITLNRAEAPSMAGASGAPPLAPARASRGLVLYIEDNLANLKLIEQVLSRRPGISVIPAMQGGLGLQLARDHLPDLVLLDLHLPDIKGDEVLARLLREPMTASIPVVVASADATERQIERLVRMGARAYLTKPIDVRRLLDLVDEVLGDP